MQFLTPDLRYIHWDLSNKISHCWHIVWIVLHSALHLDIHWVWPDLLHTTAHCCCSTRCGLTADMDDLFSASLSHTMDTKALAGITCHCVSVPGQSAEQLLCSLDQLYISYPHNVVWVCGVKSLVMTVDRYIYAVFLCWPFLLWWYIQDCAMYREKDSSKKSVETS